MGEETIPTVKYHCKGPKVEGGGRVTCGHDMTEAILSVPFDGETRAVECPDCGTSTKVTNTPPEESPP